MRIGARLTLCVLLAGCVSVPPIEQSAPTLSETPFYPDTGSLCGPSALATMLGASGVGVSVETLIEQIYLPGRQGALQAEILASVRRHDRLPISLQASEAQLLEALRAGYPVLVLQRLGILWQRTWHYAVVVGFDAARNVYILRSSDDPKKILRRREFLRTWGDAARWGYVVVAADQPPEFVGVAAWLDAAVDADSAGRLDLAGLAFAAGRQQWPDEPMFHFGVGNVLSQQQRYAEARTAFHMALEQNPDHVPSTNNLAYVLYQLGCTQRARRLLQSALRSPALTGSEQKLLRTTLAEILQAPNSAFCKMK